ncbi:hypothetical protein [Deinococcus sp. QL22]|uniref:hypothetical protein n=1 Tax=Deinococcus sp. QL22 TaxID=2939437 RepID=UPI0020178CA6|nr:hypothetical protein [Deinococcus sp. QL22]UQN09791.1 hypothetical protein M1R55_25320 [Deinococcus sp. QL22]
MLESKTKLHDALYIPLKFPRQSRYRLASAPGDTIEIPLLMVLDLRDSLIPEAQHRRVLELCDQGCMGVRLLVISPEPCCADVQIHPETLDVAVQYIGVMLHDPHWRADQWRALLLPGAAGRLLALLHCLQQLSEDHLAQVLQVVPKPLLPGAEWVSVLKLNATLEPLSAPQHRNSTHFSRFKRSTRVVTPSLS